MDVPTTEVNETAPTAEPSASIADHASQFGPDAHQSIGESSDETSLPDNATAEQKALHHANEQRRERDTGKFKEGKVRHRAKSQQASVEDVPRIQQLTGRAKSAEERAEKAERELQQFRQQQTTTSQPQSQQAQQARPEPRFETTAHTDPQPRDDDPKYGGDWGAYLTDHARWAARQEFQEQQRAQQQQAQVNQRMGAWAQRVTTAREKYPDYDAVCFGPTARITKPDDVGGPGSVIDSFIIEDDGGAEIKYHLETHPQELDSLLRMSGLGQAKTLSLLSQRLLSSSSAQAGTTGSAAGRKVVQLPPRPPNPVRTEAQRVSDDGSMEPASSIAEHSSRFGQKRRSN